MYLCTPLGAAPQTLLRILLVEFPSNMFAGLFDMYGMDEAVLREPGTERLGLKVMTNLWSMLAWSGSFSCVGERRL
jgi:hypothetical protein